MLDQIPKIFNQLKFRYDDDFVDRLNYYFTSAMLLVFALLVSAKQYVGSPMQCWVPAYFTLAMEDYTEDYCWVQNTWFLLHSAQIPPDVGARESRQIIYYQWTPFILLLAALFAHLPCLLWRSLGSLAGYDIHQIVSTANQCHLQLDPETRKAGVRLVANSILDHQQQLSYQSYPPPFLTSVKKQIVLLLYLLVKVAYSANNIGLILLLNLLLGVYQPMFGLELLKDLYRGREWHESGIFPRVTMCDFEVRVLGNRHRHTIQCVLMINMFNEKIFLLLWFWFASMALVSAASLGFWACLLFRKRRYCLVKDRLERLHLGTLEISHFLTCLNGNSYFILAMIEIHSGELIANEIIQQLWQTIRKFENCHTDQNAENGFPESVFQKPNFTMNVGNAVGKKRRSWSFQEMPLPTGTLNEDGKGRNDRDPHTRPLVLPLLISNARRSNPGIIRRTLLYRNRRLRP